MDLNRIYWKSKLSVNVEHQQQHNWFYSITGYTIPYVYWWFTAIVLYIGTVYALMGLAVGGFCAAETFSPEFVAWLASY